MSSIELRIRLLLRPTMFYNPRLLYGVDCDLQL